MTLQLAATMAVLLGAEALVASEAAEPRRSGGGMIPDRVSIERESLFFFPLYTALGVRIDGVESNSVVEFCVSEGWVRTCFWTALRQMKRERGRIITQLREGVEVEPYWKGGQYADAQPEPVAANDQPRERPAVSREVARRLRQQAAREAKLAARASR